MPSVPCCAVSFVLLLLLLLLLVVVHFVLDIGYTLVATFRSLLLLVLVIRLRQEQSFFITYLQGTD